MQAAAGDWEIWQRHLVVVPVVVLAMVFVIIPGIQRGLARPAGHARQSKPGSSPEMD